MRCCMSAKVMVLLFWSESEFCSDWGSSLYGFSCRSGVLYGISIGSSCSRAVPWEPAHQQSLQSLGNTCTFLHPCAGFVAAVKCSSTEELV